MGRGGEGRGDVPSPIYRSQNNPVGGGGEAAQRLVGWTHSSSFYYCLNEKKNGKWGEWEESEKRLPWMSAFKGVTGSAGLSALFREQCRPAAGKDLHRTGAPWRKAGLPNVRKESGMTTNHPN